MDYKVFVNYKAQVRQSVTDFFVRGMSQKILVPQNYRSIERSFKKSDVGGAP